MANTRTGIARGTRGRRRSLRWDSDPEVLGRMASGERLRAQGLTRAEIAVHLAVSQHTVSKDLARLIDSRRAAGFEAVDDHIASLMALKRRAWEMLESGPVLVPYTDPSGKTKYKEVEDRSALLAQLRSIEMDIAKLDGSLVQRTEVKGVVSLLDIVRAASDGTDVVATSPRVPGPDQLLA